MHLQRCLELAEVALRDGDEPFGSVLVSGDGRVLAEYRNRVSSGDRTRHSEFELARWAAANMTIAQRAAATVYTSGEHCPMCAAAHGWVSLGRIVYAWSSEELATWLAQIGAPSPPVRTLPIEAIVPGVEVRGPFEELTVQVRGAAPTVPCPRLSLGAAHRHAADWRLAVSAKHVVHPERTGKNGVARQPFSSEEAPDEAPS